MLRPSSRTVPTEKRRNPMANESICWIGPEDPPDYFPPVSRALTEPDGLLAAGGDLSPDRLLWAYRHAIFPWYEDGQPPLWWSPDPRAVFLPGDFHLSRRLRRSVRTSALDITVNSHFADVIRACAAPRRHLRGTWITAEMIAAYERMHALGWAHSIEIVHDGELCGGLYGIAIGSVFFGESMFSRVSNASKFALLFLNRMLDSGRLTLIDCQLVSAHLQSLGARSLPRTEFVRLLDISCPNPVAIEFRSDAPMSVPRLLEI